jgi:hypothetical protein
MASSVGCAPILPSGPLALILSGHRAPEVAWAPRQGISALCRMCLAPTNGNMSPQPCIDASTVVGPATHHRPRGVIIPIPCPGGSGPRPCRRGPRAASPMERFGWQPRGDTAPLTEGAVTLERAPLQET